METTVMLVQCSEHFYFSDLDASADLLFLLFFFFFSDTVVLTHYLMTVEDRVIKRGSLSYNLHEGLPQVMIC